MLSTKGTKGYFNTMGSVTEVLCCMGCMALEGHSRVGPGVQLCHSVLQMCGTTPCDNVLTECSTLSGKVSLLCGIA